MRTDRRADELRPIRFEPGFTTNAHGSVLVCWGKMKVLATVSLVEAVPEFLEGRGVGWLTAEYAMLPGSVPKRKRRDRGNVVDGRCTEIQRLIGRSLRSAVDLKALGENTLYVDCDVLEADGGTRVASITASTVALSLAVRELMRKGRLEREVRVERVAGVSVGIVKGEVLLDLDAVEDRGAGVDMNVVMLNGTEYLELQGTAEGTPFGDETLGEVLGLARRGIGEIDALQQEVLAGG